MRKHIVINMWYDFVLVFQYDYMYVSIIYRFQDIINTEIVTWPWQSVTHLLVLIKVSLQSAYQIWVV